jgi:hypothetical protein
MTNAKLVAKAIVSDWMHLEADERKMDVLVKLIEVELERAFANGMKAARPKPKFRYFGEVPM